jgi:hypothetical protein
MAYWWVNQSKTYQAERSAGIMWAPQQTEAGRRLGHWTATTRCWPMSALSAPRRPRPV